MAAAAMGSEAGAALVTVLLFMTLTFILITSMLAVTGNEVVISGLQRDGIRAVEFAQAGIDEAIKRMEEGRPFYMGGTPWPTSLDSSTTVLVTRRVVGVNAAYLEIAATSTVGRSTRRISRLVLQRTLTFPPNITFADSVDNDGNASINSGDAYSRTFFEYKQLPDASVVTYAGWGISKDPGGGGGTIPPCYTKAACEAAGQMKWYPGMRRTEAQASAIAQDILNLAAANQATCSDSTTLVKDAPGWQAGDKYQDEVEVTSRNEPLFGWDEDDGVAVGGSLPCGLPYKWIRQVVDNEDADTVADRPRWFKTIVFEQWFNLYWEFDEAALTYKPRASYQPKYGAIPPFPEVNTIEGNYDRTVTCTGTCTITGGDFGCYAPQMNCGGTPEVSRPIMVWLDGDANTNWTINANLQGHGTVVVTGNLKLAGTFEYWGTIMATGTVENTSGAGNPRIHGGLVAQNTLSLTGSIEVFGGGSISNVPIGRSVVIGKAWWER